MFEQQYGRKEEFFLKRHALTTAKEVLQQPFLWRRLAELLTNQQAEINAFMEKLPPLAQLRIILTGAGSSAFIGESLQAMLLRTIGLRTEAVATTDIVSAPESYLTDVPTTVGQFLSVG